MNYPMTEKSGEYLRKLLEQAETSPAMREILQATHHLLAGGSVEVKIVKPGEPNLVAELTAAQSKALRQANEANRQAGTYVTAIA